MFAKKNKHVGLCSSDVKLDIYNREELKNSANVMGVIRGSVEPGEKDSALATEPHLGHGEEVTSRVKPIESSIMTTYAFVHRTGKTVHIQKHRR